MRLKGFRESLQEIAISGRAPAAAAPHQKKSFSLLIDKDSWTFPTFAHFVWQNLCIWQLCKVINLTTNLISWLRNLPPTTDHLGAAVRLPWNFDEFPTSAVRSRKKGKREKERERVSVSKGSEAPPWGWATFPYWYCATLQLLEHRIVPPATVRARVLASMYTYAPDDGEAASPVTSDGLSCRRLLLALLRSLRFAWNVLKTKVDGTNK